MSSQFIAARYDRLEPKLTMRREKMSRLPRLKEGIPVVMFAPDEDDILFLGVGRVDKLREEREDIADVVTGETAELIVEKASIVEEHDFEAPRSLRHLAGSLARVWRFLDPQRHFRHRLVGFDDKLDLEVIRKNEVAIHRTVFRYLFEALPYPVRADFVRLNESLFRSGDKPIIREYSSLAPLLLDYTSRRFGDLLELVEAAGKRFQDIKATGLPSLSQLRLEEPDHSVTMNIGSTAQAMAKDIGLLPALPEGRGIRTFIEIARNLLKDAPKEERIWRDQIPL